MNTSLNQGIFDKQKKVNFYESPLRGGNIMYFNYGLNNILLLPEVAEFLLNKKWRILYWRLYSADEMNSGIIFHTTQSAIHRDRK